MNQQEQPKQPLDFFWKPKTTITLTSKEFDILTQPLQMFEMALAVSNMKRDQAIQKGDYLPVFEDDVDMKTGKLLDEKAFFEGKKPSVIQSVSKLVDTSGAPLN